MKKYFVALLAATLLCAASLAGGAAVGRSGVNGGRLFPTARAAEIVASGQCGKVDKKKGLDGSQVTWTLDSDGLLTVSGDGAMTNYSLGDSPWDRSNTAIRTVVIQTGVSSVGNSAFYGCVGLTAVTIPDSVTSIGEYSFRDCTGLTAATIPASVTSIGSAAFLAADVDGSGVIESSDARLILRASVKLETL